MDSFLILLSRWIWSPPLLILLIGVGILLTFKTRFVQFRYLYYAHKLAFTRHDDSAKGDVSHFQALMTSLAGTIGIGSITGVAMAMTIGGYGALFWMWMTAVVGMATKFSEAILAVKYRVVDEAGEMCGGPMEYLDRGAKVKWLAIIFSIFGCLSAFGEGNIVQISSVTDATTDLLGLNPLYVGLLLMILTGSVLFGGIKSIGKVTSVLVPTMTIFYVGAGLIVIILKINLLPQVFSEIIRSAFTAQAASGGFLGASVMMALRIGVTKGVFSNEAGLGTSPIVSAAAKTDVPGRQALVSMSSVFITTIIVCTITGLVIALGGLFGESGANGEVLRGSALVLNSFKAILPYGGHIVTFALIPFAYSTTLCWAYYGEKCVEYLLGVKSVKYYRIIFTLLILPGAFLSIDFVWAFADIMNGLMALPNLVGLLLLASTVASEVRAFDNLYIAEKT